MDIGTSSSSRGAPAPRTRMLPQLIVPRLSWGGLPAPDTSPASSAANDPSGPMHVIFWAERVLITAAHAAACPRGLDPVLAGALPVNGLTALQALEMLELGRGQRLLVTNGGGATGSLAIQLAVAMGAEVTTTASGSAADRLRGLGAAEIIDYHDPDWPGQARGGFDGALTAAIGTAEAALPLVRDGGRLCSLTSDAPAGDRGIASTDLYVRPDATQLAQLARQVSEGALQMTPEVYPLREGPAAFTRVAAGRASGRKLVLIS
jgi:NADPH:quinone reductase-like Zn-dependent oxidoreductase